MIRKSFRHTPRFSPSFEDTKQLNLCQRMPWEKQSDFPTVGGGVQALILKLFFALPKYNLAREIRHKTVTIFLNCGKHFRNNFCNHASIEFPERRESSAWNAPIADNTKKLPPCPLKVKTQPRLLSARSELTRQTGKSSQLPRLLRLHRFPWKIPRVFIMRACLIFDIFQTIDPWKPNASIPRKTSAKIF